MKVLLSAFIALSALDLGLIGPWMWVSGAFFEARCPLDVDRIDLESFEVPRTDKPGTISLSSTFSVGVVENWYFDRYNAFRERAKLEPEAARKLLGVLDGRRLYFSQTLEHNTIQEFVDDADRFKEITKVISYSGDQLVLEVHAPQAGYLSFIDNWDQDWVCTVDGIPTRIHLLFGTFKSVWLPLGEHQVIFAYRPSFAFGRRVVH